MVRIVNFHKLVECWAEREYDVRGLAKAFPGRTSWNVDVICKDPLVSEIDGTGSIRFDADGKARVLDLSSMIVGTLTIKQLHRLGLASVGPVSAVGAVSKLYSAEEKPRKEKYVLSTFTHGELEAILHVFPNGAAPMRILAFRFTSDQFGSNEIARPMQTQKSHKYTARGIERLYGQQKSAQVSARSTSKLSHVDPRRSTKIIKKLIANAKLVCSTAIGVGLGVLGSQSKGFTWVILEEAAQSAYCVQDEARKFDFQRSTFEVFKSSTSTSSSSTSTDRMHPSLIDFLSKQFCNNGIHSVPFLSTERRPPVAAPWNSTHHLAFVPVAGVEPRVGTSFKNFAEASKIAELARALLKARHSADDMCALTGYTAQVECISKTLSAQRIAVQVRTVDGFQGRESDIVIFSAVRATGLRRLGF
ncbi:AAA domain-containing protein [Cladochytrium replicatum]|nr:AAA domain-containing protein [Cladochytrium replicatum]